MNAQLKLNLGSRGQTDLSFARGNGGKKSTANGYISSLWHFPDHPGTRSLYRWYGTLPRPLIDQLLDLYCADGTDLFDPFLGSGITAEIASKRGIQTLGWDANPLACLLAEANCVSLVPKAAEIFDVIERIETRLGRSRANNPPSALMKDEFAYTRKWFRTETLTRVAKLLEAISDIDDVELQRLLFILTSQEIRNVACVDARCTHHLVRKEKPFIDPWQRVKESLLSAGGNAVSSRLLEARRPIIEQRSVVHDIPEGKFGFVLAHPPYLGVIHYNQIHRLATDLLAYTRASCQPASLMPYEFGIAQIKAADVSTDNEAQYDDFIYKFAQRIHSVVTPGGVCALIIGDQRFQGRLRHPFTKFIDKFEGIGFSLEENFIWALQNNGGMHVLRRGHFIDHNYILIFRNRNAARASGRDNPSRSRRGRSKE